MKTIMFADDIADLQPCVATIGFFDGVHRGHRFLLGHVSEMAHEKGIESTVITFDRHPREILNSDFQPRLLSTLEEKVFLLSKTGMDNCVVLPFSEKMAGLSARDFISDILSARINVRTLIVGYDNRFGHNRSEGFEDYVRYGRETDVEVRQWKPYVMEEVSISSSVVRSFLMEGEVEMAERCLGYPYTIVGRVIHGEHVGTELGFPTANIVVLEPRKLIPSPGVYAVRVRLDSGEYRNGMMNIGMRPTFDGNRMTLEVHLFRFCGDIYGECMAVSFVRRLRSEKKFRSPAELIGQLRKDKEMAEACFGE
ncbi:bifunctional riboflavin kinase/FAD synthetase [Xylanibacter muris]|uniref:Riboflavin biosynthesis protein n=1 Tax=Xylanibacter muris TaxID=2736290 RepID=A0ABX2AMS6_9BACT|nr:bifunctional riboflavin kinase/FAD synthetase [Xylanibacter muris]NPD92536.1 bifunctional riboflavin kinase/FAD synthetase [Xylanibacter muris]